MMPCYWVALCYGEETPGDYSETPPELISLVTEAIFEITLERLLSYSQDVMQPSSLSKSNFPRIKIKRNTAINTQVQTHTAEKNTRGMTECAHPPQRTI